MALTWTNTLVAAPIRSNGTETPLGEELLNCARGHGILVPNRVSDMLGPEPTLTGDWPFVTVVGTGRGLLPSSLWPRAPRIPVETKPPSRTLAERIPGNTARSTRASRWLH